MPFRYRFYVLVGAVFAVSLFVFVLLPQGALLQELAAIPLIASLVAALFHVLREQAAHEHKNLLLETEQRFALGASSHMANVAFDRHVLFCEEYVAEVFKTLDTLFREGPTQEALPHASALFEIRRRYAVWLTGSVEENLQRFEAALRRLGAADWYLRNAEGAIDRQEKINTMYKTFADILGPENMGPTWEGEPLSPELAISGVVHGLRRVLGIEELTRLRGALIEKALHGVRPAGLPFALPDVRQPASPSAARR